MDGRKYSSLTSLPPGRKVPQTGRVWGASGRRDRPNQCSYNVNDTGGSDATFRGRREGRLIAQATSWSLLLLNASFHAGGAQTVRVWSDYEPQFRVGFTTLGAGACKQAAEPCWLSAAPAAVAYRNVAASVLEMRRTQQVYSSI
jgi:hypothetical protein